MGTRYGGNKQLDEVGHRLIPGRSHPLLKTGDHAPIDPVKGHRAHKQECQTWEYEQSEKHHHLATLLLP